MEKIKYKKGLTLIDVIISIMLIFCIAISFSFLIPKFYSNINKINETLEENIFIENTYKIFSSDPYNFRENMEQIYSISLNNDTFTKTMFENIKFNFYEDDFMFCVIVKYKDNEVEKWVRKKVIQ